MLGIVVDPGLLVTLIPLGVMLLGVITFEMAMAVTISTLPRSRFQQKWTPQEQRRVLGVFFTIFSVWPAAALLVFAHLSLPIFGYLLCDLAALALVVLGLRWLRHGVHQRRLIMAGHCAGCFYDLRGNTESEHCPECGAELSDHPALVKPKRRHRIQSA